MLSKLNWQMANAFLNFPNNNNSFLSSGNFLLKLSTIRLIFSNGCTKIPNPVSRKRSMQTIWFEATQQNRDTKYNSSLISDGLEALALHVPAVEARPIAQM